MAKDLLSLREFQVEEESPGRVVKAFRKNFGLTLKEMTELTGIAESHFSAIENERQELGLARAEVIAAVFGVEPSILLFPAGYVRAEQKEIDRIRERAAKLIKRKAG